MVKKTGNPAKSTATLRGIQQDIRNELHQVDEPPADDGPQPLSAGARSLIEGHGAEATFGERVIDGIEEEEDEPYTEERPVVRRKPGTKVSTKVTIAPPAVRYRVPESVEEIPEPPSQVLSSFDAEDQKGRHSSPVFSPSPLEGSPLDRDFNLSLDDPDVGDMAASSDSERACKSPKTNTNVNPGKRKELASGRRGSVVTGVEPTQRALKMDSAKEDLQVGGPLLLSMARGNMDEAVRSYKEEIAALKEKVEKNNADLKVLSLSNKYMRDMLDDRQREEANAYESKLLAETNKDQPLRPKAAPFAPLAEPPVPGPPPHLSGYPMHAPQPIYRQQSRYQQGFQSPFQQQPFQQQQQPFQPPFQPPFQQRPDSRARHGSFDYDSYDTYEQPRQQGYNDYAGPSEPRGDWQREPSGDWQQQQQYSRDPRYYR